MVEFHNNACNVVGASPREGGLHQLPSCGLRLLFLSHERNGVLNISANQLKQNEIMIQTDKAKVFASVNGLFFLIIRGKESNFQNPHNRSFTERMLGAVDQ